VTKIYLQTQKKAEFFNEKLGEYKKLIDDDIEKYSKKIQHETLVNYGVKSRVATDAYLNLLARGGKRIRGALTMVGYEMMGGTNRQMIIRAARAIEMIHTYILIMDDIQDNSLIRRGGSTVHKELQNYHQKNYLSGDGGHFGISLALNAMGIGNHSAQVILANLDVAENLKIKALSILNQSIVVTSHGQTNDIMNEVSSKTTMQDVDRVLEWKTAYYTFLNPLTFGMVLAGADCSATDAVRDYCLNAGRAFQITDDILGIFASEQESGKSSMDDIREGKRTMLVVNALDNADNADKNFLIQMLGNKNITQTEFNRCKDILVESGAYNFAKKEANKCVKLAIESLNNQDLSWPSGTKEFLIGLVQSLVNRKS